MASINVLSREDWHAHRARHVGGSEIASLFYAWALPSGDVRYYHMFEHPPEGAAMIGCVSRHTTGFRLYQIKAGKIDPDDLDAVERVQAGNFLEPALAAWAMQKWGMPLRKVQRYITHPSVAGFGCSRDYEEVTKGVGGWENYPPVEFKNVDYLIFRDQWVAEGEEILTPPMDLTLQVQHQLAGNAAPYGRIVACVGGNRLYRGVIERHPGTIKRIEQAVTAFWQAIETKQEPFAFADFDTVADLLASGVKDRVTDLSADNEAPMLCGRYLRLKSHKDRVEEQLDRIKSRLGMKIGDGTSANIAGYRITWPSINRPEKVIPQRLQTAMTYRGGFTVKERL